jgi:hypothetical protein
MPATYGARTVVITFDPHPLAVVNPERAPLLLQTLAQRLRAIAALGADAVLVNQFSPEFAARTGEQFIRELQREAGPIAQFQRRAPASISASSAAGTSRCFARSGPNWAPPPMPARRCPSARNASAAASCGRACAPAT